MVQRRIVEIDEEKCDGCGLCIPACHEGAIGECPQDAIKIIERDAGEYDEIAVLKRMGKMAKENKEFQVSCLELFFLEFYEKIYYNYS